MPRPKSVFVCQQCGNESPKWLGHCPDCDQWNTYVETVVKHTPAATPPTPVQELSQLPTNSAPRLALPLTEFNRVLGGGIVPGSMVLIAGDPGIGKSTLLLEVAGMTAEREGKVLYVSGEESVHQIKLRADRLGIRGEGLYLLPETDLENIIERGREMSPRLVVIDSIQAVYLSGLTSAAGSLAQVRECTLRLMRWAKSSNTPIFIVGHVTKDGAIAGPHTLEHIVDVVLYLEGERFSAYRLLRGVKNRFGSTNEVGVFEMRDQGLVEIANPSQVFLSQRSQGAIGSVIVPTLEGTRPLLVEIQALTSPTSFGLPRRNANGVDYNRLLMITAVLTKRVRLALGNQDIIANVVGGIRVNEPAADLGLALAIASSSRNARVNPDLVAIGEVGLSGELRAVSQLEKRLSEAAKLGFKSCLLPPLQSGQKPPPGIEPIPVSSLSQALKLGLER
ncbi:MAG: DNA repair protein RadA [Dehalococcoidia bacterium]|nr:MAG: DNA repair protein RadA [Dehalococcoidia bacterium]